MKKMLITGATGFLGHFLVEEFLDDYDITCIVRPGTKNLIRLQHVLDRITIIEHDVRTSYVTLLSSLKDTNVILHTAGNPSSEASLNDPVSVVKDNILSTLYLLELARHLPLERFFYYGAGESFGPIPVGTHSAETSAYNSVSPYAASKSGAEELCVAYSHTWNIPVSITHVTNTFGPMSQCKRLPVIAIKKLLYNETINLHADENGIGGRRWLYAGDVASQTKFILQNQKTNCEKWNSTGPKFINNLEFVQLIADILGKKLTYNIVPITRNGHSSYISMSDSKIREHGWTELKSIEERLEETVSWYAANQEWLYRE